MELNNPLRYLDHSKDELIDLLCLTITDLDILRSLLRDTGYDMSTPIAPSAYDAYHRLKAAANSKQG
jgi:hypothetical protein